MMTLKQLRLLAGYTQKEAAKILGVSFISIGRWEDGTFKPTPEKREKLAKLYNVDISVINDSINIRKDDIQWQTQLREVSLHSEKARTMLSSLLEREIKECFLKNSRG